MEEIKNLVKHWVVPPGVWQLMARMKRERQSGSGLSSAERMALLVQNEELKDRHVGSRCFIFGAGPSVNEQNIGKLEGGTARKVSVKMGVSDGMRIEILEGLRLDQQVILVGKQPLKDGQAVKGTEAK